MSAAQETHRPGPRPIGEGTWFAGRAGLAMPAIVAAWSLFLLIGSLRMDTGDADFPGPAFFPGILGAVGLVLAVLQALAVVEAVQQVARSDFFAAFGRAFVVGG